MFATAYAVAVVLAVSVTPTSASESPYLVPRTTGDVWDGVNITTAALQIQGSISSPTCSALSACKKYVSSVIPQCLQLQGAPGCWCSLEPAMHECSICMLSPSDASTSAEQTQTVTSAHMNFHLGCAAYETSINATSSMSMSMDGMSMDTPTSTSASGASSTATVASHSKSNVGPIVGGVVGGIVGLALIAAVTFILVRKKRGSGEHGAGQVVAPYVDGHGHGQNGMSEHKPAYSQWQSPPQSAFPYSGAPSPGIPSYTQSNADTRKNVVSSSTDYDVSMLNALNVSPPPPFNPYSAVSSPRSPSDAGQLPQQSTGDYAASTLESNKGQARGYPAVAEAMR